MIISQITALTTIVMDNKHMNHVFLPNEVFTPSSPEVNLYIYVPRPELEQDLRRAIDIGNHIIIHGESGSGESWLYKKVFNSDGINMEAVNFANCHRLGSINAAILEKCKFYNELTPKESKETAEGGFSPVGMGVNYVKEMTYIHEDDDPLLKLLKLMRAKDTLAKNIIVLDNFEQIFKNENFMAELSSMLILLDDEEYSKFNFLFCIAGTTREVRDFLSKIKNIATISNSVTEIPEVSRLTMDQAREIITVGFLN